MDLLIETLIGGGGFEPENFLPKSGREPVCPLYGIIEVCGEFAGIDNFYCGNRVKHVDNMGILSGRRGNDYIPRTICSEIENNLCTQIHFLQVPAPDISKLLEKPTKDLTSQEIEELSSARELEDNKKEILKRFKLATFNICKVHSNDNSKDLHFKPVDSPEDITDKEAIKTAGLFLEALQKQTSKCKQMPHGGFVGEMS